MNKCKLIGYVQNIQTQTGTRADGGQWTKYSFTLASVLGKIPNNINCYTWHSNLGKSLVNGQKIELIAYWPVNREYIGKDGLQKSFLSLEVNEIENLEPMNSVQKQVAQSVESSPFDTKQAVAQIENESEPRDDDALEWLENFGTKTKKCTWTFLEQDKAEVESFVNRMKVGGYDPQITLNTIGNRKVIQVSLETKEDIINSYNVVYEVYKEKTLKANKQPKPINPQDGIKDAFGNVYSKSQVAQTINKINQDVQSKLNIGEMEINLGKHSFTVDKDTGEVVANEIEK